MVSLRDRKAAVIGGTAGIGLETARLLHERGAEVTVGSREESHFTAVVERIGDGVEAIAVDAEDASSLREFFDRAGPLDDLVVTVSRRGGMGPAAELDGQDLEDAFKGKSAAHLRTVAEVLPTLAERGSVTLIGAGSAQAALPGTALLAAVNGAVEAAVPPLARELAPRRVNAVSPGVIETDWWDVLPAGDREATFEQLSAQTPVGRIGNAEEVAHAICALIENDYINGVVLPCDGGLRWT